MKRASIYMLSVAFLTAGIISCGKTTRGKMVNDWKVITSSKEYNYSAQSGEKLLMTEVEADNSYTIKSEHTNPGDSTTDTYISTWTVVENSWSIKKDGTWIWKRHLKSELGSDTDERIMTQSGTWSFIRKNKTDEFKKNERVLFNVLLSEERQIISLSDVTGSTSYKTGEKSLIFSVKESSRKLLEMEYESNNLYSSTGSDTKTQIKKWSVTLN